MFSLMGRTIDSASKAGLHSANSWGSRIEAGHTSLEGHSDFLILRGLHSCAREPLLPRDREARESIHYAVGSLDWLDG